MNQSKNRDFAARLGEFHFQTQREAATRLAGAALFLALICLLLSRGFYLLFLFIRR